MRARKRKKKAIKSARASVVRSLSLCHFVCVVRVFVSVCMYQTKCGPSDRVFFFFQKLCSSFFFLTFFFRLFFFSFSHKQKTSKREKEKQHTYE